MERYDLVTYHEAIAGLMLKHRGNLNLVSREPEIRENAMALRGLVKSNPDIRSRYQELLTEELQDYGLHISERILKMAEMQEVAYGDLENDILPDPKTAIEISKHISDLIKESRTVSVSSNSAAVITSKESVGDILRRFLES